MSGMVFRSKRQRQSVETGDRDGGSETGQGRTAAGRRERRTSGARGGMITEVVVATSPTLRRERSSSGNWASTNVVPRVKLVSQPKIISVDQEKTATSTGSTKFKDVGDVTPARSSNGSVSTSATTTHKIHTRSKGTHASDHHD
jgi:hypothetical protein